MADPQKSTGLLQTLGSIFQPAWYDYKRGITSDISQLPFIAIFRSILIQTYCNNTTNKEIKDQRNAFIMGHGKDTVQHRKGKNSAITIVPTVGNTLGYSKLFNPINLVFLAAHTLKQAVLYASDKIFSRRVSTGIKTFFSALFFIPDMVAFAFTKASNALMNRTIGPPTNNSPKIAPEPILPVSEPPPAVEKKPVRKSLNGSTASMAPTFQLSKPEGKSILTAPSRNLQESTAIHVRARSIIPDAHTSKDIKNVDTPSNESRFKPK